RARGRADRAGEGPPRPAEPDRADDSRGAYAPGQADACGRRAPRHAPAPLALRPARRRQPGRRRMARAGKRRDRGTPTDRRSWSEAPGVAIRIDDSLDGIDWGQVKAELAADDFDNGRTPDALRLSFERSQHVAIARDGDRVVGTARLLSDGVCNAFLIDVW